jgi:hypothetical protein
MSPAVALGGHSERYRPCPAISRYAASQSSAAILRPCWTVLASHAANVAVARSGSIPAETRRARVADRRARARRSGRRSAGHRDLLTRVDVGTPATVADCERAVPSGA